MSGENPKAEIRNPKEGRRPKSEMAGWDSFWIAQFFTSPDKIRILNIAPKTVLMGLLSPRERIRGEGEGRDTPLPEPVSHSPRPCKILKRKPRRGDMVIEGVSNELLSPVGAACFLSHLATSRWNSIPPLQGWSFVLTGFYKHVVPTGLDTRTEQIFRCNDWSASLLTRCRERSLGPLLYFKSLIHILIQSHPSGRGHLRSFALPSPALSVPD